jgi:N-acetylglucosamine transport system substrate-binding protein
MKKILALVATLAIVFSLVSCGTSSGTSTTKTTLKIAFFQGGYGDAWAKAIGTKFMEANPDVTIAYEGDPGLTEKMGPRLESGANLPDLAFVLQTNWEVWAIKGYLADLSDIYGKEVDNGKTLAQKLQPAIKDYGLINKKYWIVPWNDGATGLIYNVKMFQTNNWQVPVTVDDLNALLPQIKAKGIAPFAWGGKVASYWDFPTIGWWAQYEGAAGIETFKAMASPNVYAQQGRLKAFQEFEKLILDPTNSIAGAAAMDHIQSQMAFVQGKAAMIPDGAWLENEMKTSLPKGFEMKMMQLPTISGAKDTKVNYTSSGDFIVVPKKAKNVELAKKFLQFMSTDAMLKLYTEKTGAPRPFVYDTSAIPGLTEFNKSVLNIWQNSKNIYMFSANPIYYSQLYNWPNLGAPYMQIFQGDVTAQDAYDQMASYASTNWETLKTTLGLS